MNKLLATSLVGISILISGCSTKQQSDDSYFKYVNKNHIIGDKNNYIKKVTFTEGEDKKITFYIDNFPYKKEFNLCNKYDFIQNLRNNHEDSIYIENKNKNCKSFIHINKVESLKIPYSTSFNFNFYEAAIYNKKTNTFFDRFSPIQSTQFYNEGINDIESVKEIYLSIE